MFEIPAANSVTGFVISDDLFSSGEMILFFFSRPPITLSTASWKSSISTCSFPFRAAISAASLQTFAISAPAKPGVCSASLWISTFVEILIGFKMHFENVLPSFQIGFINRYLPVESSRAQQRSIQYVGPVRCRQNDNSAFAAKSIHFNQQLVQGTFPFIVAHDGILTSCTANRIDFINKNDTR